jgi:hypothetical protein
MFLIYVQYTIHSFAVKLIMNNMTQLKIYLSVFLLAMVIGVQAQQYGIIKGRVLDSDNLSMPGAAVIIESINKGAIY